MCGAVALAKLEPKAVAWLHAVSSAADSPPAATRKKPGFSVGGRDACEHGAARLGENDEGLTCHKNEAPAAFVCCVAGTSTRPVGGTVIVWWCCCGVTGNVWCCCWDCNWTGCAVRLYRPTPPLAPPGLATSCSSGNWDKNTVTMETSWKSIRCC